MVCLKDIRLVLQCSCQRIDMCLGRILFRQDTLYKGELIYRNKESQLDRIQRN
jgi:hypothetical protein